MTYPQICIMLKYSKRIALQTGNMFPSFETNLPLFAFFGIASSTSLSSLLISMGNSFCVVGSRDSFAFGLGFAFVRYMSVNILFIWLLCTDASCTNLTNNRLYIIYLTEKNRTYLHELKIRIFFFFCRRITIQSIAVQYGFVGCGYTK